MLWEPFEIFTVNTLLDEGLDTIIFSLILVLDLFHIEHVVPDTVVSSVMIEESVCTSFEDLSRQRADVALLPHVLQDSVLLSTEISKCINNDTEDNLKNDDLDTDFVSQIVYQSESVSPLIVFSIGLGNQMVTDSGIMPWAVIESGEEALLE